MVSSLLCAKLARQGTGSTLDAKMRMTVPFDIATHNGIITIRNPATGQHRTVKVVTSTPDGETHDKKVRWARELQAECVWKSFAIVTVDGKCLPFRKFASNSYFAKLARIIQEPGRFADRLEFMFEGRCRKCNRRLTNPESLSSGIGPECRKVER